MEPVDADLSKREVGNLNKQINANAKALTL